MNEIPEYTLRKSRRARRVRLGAGGGEKWRHWWVGEIPYSM